MKAQREGLVLPLQRQWPLRVAGQIESSRIFTAIPYLHSTHHKKTPTPGRPANRRDIYLNTPLEALRQGP